MLRWGPWSLSGQDPFGALSFFNRVIQFSVGLDWPPQGVSALWIGRNLIPHLSFSIILQVSPFPLSSQRATLPVLFIHFDTILLLLLPPFSSFPPLCPLV